MKPIPFGFFFSFLFLSLFIYFLKSSNAMDFLLRTLLRWNTAPNKVIQIYLMPGYVYFWFF